MTAYPKSCGRSWSFIIIFGRLSFPECVYVFIARDVVRTVERQSVAGVSCLCLCVCHVMVVRARRRRARIANAIDQITLSSSSSAGQ